MNHQSTCLITGGGKGITAQVAIAIAQQYHCKFILLGRSPIDNPEPQWAQGCEDELVLKKRILEYLLQQGEAKPTPVKVQQEYKPLAAKREVENTLVQIRQAGGEAEYLSVDVTDGEALTQAIANAEKRLGKITVLIHGAGNLADKPIEKKTAQDFNLVYAVKVKGLENLLEAVNPSQLEHLVLFSSVVGFYGNAGQTDYAIANEVLSKTAHLMKQKYPQCHVVSINWGPWDSGMVSPQLKRAFEENNIKTIPIPVGNQLLLEELNQDSTQAVIGSPLTPPVTPPNPQPQKFRIRRRFSLEANPFLHDHVILNRPVLPATCAMSWIANTCEQVYPGYKFIRSQNYKVLKGIVFDETLADEYIIDLGKTAQDANNNLEINAKIWSKNDAGKIRYHFSATCYLTSKPDSAPDYQDFDLTLDKLSFNRSEPIYQSNQLSLFHGVSFQGVKEILNLNGNMLTTECYLPALSRKQQGQIPVQAINGYITDVQVHALWLWLQHTHQEICLPSEIKRYEQYSFVPFNQTFYVSCDIQEKTKTAVIANLITHDENGKIYSRMLGAKGTIISF
jgi:NAD(P)-dependent dehydrogenase (short-subunit alcohol dehydrogenase family)